MAFASYVANQEPSASAGGSFLVLFWLLNPSIEKLPCDLAQVRKAVQDALSALTSLVAVSL